MRWNCSSTLGMIAVVLSMMRPFMIAAAADSLRSRCNLSTTPAKAWWGVCVSLRSVSPEEIIRNSRDKIAPDVARSILYALEIHKRWWHLGTENGNCSDCLRHDHRGWQSGCQYFKIKKQLQMKIITLCPLPPPFPCPICSFGYLSVCLSIFLSISPSLYHTTNLPACLSTYPEVELPLLLLICVCTCSRGTGTSDTSGGPDLPLQPTSLP